MTKIYELYHCKYKGEIVYIGQGAKGRHKHCNSGCSHVYELNRIHFLEGESVLDVKVVKEFSDRGSALKEEELQIRKKLPKFNKNLTNNSTKNKSLDEGARVSRTLYDGLLKNKNLSHVNREKYKNTVAEFIAYYGCLNIRDGNVPIYDKRHYKKLKLNLLANLSSHVRSPRHNTKKNMSAHCILEDCIKHNFGYDLKEKVCNKNQDGLE